MDIQIDKAPEQHYARIETKQSLKNDIYAVRYKRPKKKINPIKNPKPVKKIDPKPSFRSERPVQVLDPFGLGFKIHVNEMRIIKGIINFIHEKSTMALGWPSNQKYLLNEGKKIEHIHPLCFIWAVLKDQTLKAKVKSFKDNSMFALKWSGFLGYSMFHDNGFGKNMERYYNHRNPNDYQREFEAFYKALGVKSSVANPYALKKDWRGFASVLLESSTYN